ncbi:MAG: gas vesicle protein [Armatimonadetes bacterium]|nr:gas vesicle protein [Armatimonadota bacterium]
MAVAQRGKEQLAELTGLQPDTVSSLAQDEKGWRVSVEMIEMKRIPDSQDVLASYQSCLDEEGRLVSYERGRRYYRDQVTRDS